MHGEALALGIPVPCRLSSLISQNAGGLSGGAAAELPVRTVVRSATQTRALLGRGTPRQRLARMMACGMMMVMMMLTGTSTKCVDVVLSYVLCTYTKCVNVVLSHVLCT